MAFDNAAPARAAARRTKKELILGVGGRAFVTRPLATIDLNDAAGQPLPSDLSDGEEVEVISWRPRSLNGLAYQIRRLKDGSEWWMLASNLRRRREPEPAPTTEALGAEAAPAADYRPRRSNR